MNTVKVDGKRSPAINRPGLWHGVTDKSFIARDKEISAWIQERYNAGGIGECVNWLDHGRIYFKSEADLTLFMLRWA